MWPVPKVMPGFRPSCGSGGLAAIDAAMIVDQRADRGEAAAPTKTVAAPTWPLPQGRSNTGRRSHSQSVAHRGTHSRSTEYRDTRRQNFWSYRE
jgi:hypothetical protein